MLSAQDQIASRARLLLRWTRGAGLTQARLQEVANRPVLRLFGVKDALALHRRITAVFEYEFTNESVRAFENAITPVRDAKLQYLRLTERRELYTAQQGISMRTTMRREQDGAWEIASHSISSLGLGDATTEAEIEQMRGLLYSASVENELLKKKVRELESQIRRLRNRL